MNEYEDVSVLRVDLEAFEDALQNAAGLSGLLDLQEQLRRATVRPQPSRLTKQLEASLTRVQGYLAEGDENE